MSNLSDKITLDDIFDYSFYDDNKKYVVKLNESKLKELFEADEIIFEETEHK